MLGEVVKMEVIRVKGLRPEAWQMVRELSSIIGER